MFSASASAAAPTDILRRWLERSLGHLASAMLFAMMLLTFIDVVGRYFFHAPIQGAYELIAIAMGILIFAALPIVTAREEHLQIGLARDLIRGRPRQAISLTFDVVSFCVLAGFAWQIWQHGLHLARSGEVMVSLMTPVAPFAFFMSVMAGVSALVVALLAVLRVRRALDR